MTTRMWIVAVALIATTIAASASPWTRRVRLAEPLSAFPRQIEEWVSRTDVPLEPALVAELGLDDYVNRTYVSAAAPVGLYVAFYDHQRIGRDIHSPLYCLPGAGWARVASSRLAIDAAARGTSAPLTVNRFLVEKGLDRLIVLFWYDVGGTAVSGEWTRKFQLMRAGLRDGRTDAALIRVTSPVLAEPDAEARAERRAIGFVRSVSPVIDKWLPPAGE